MAFRVLRLTFPPAHRATVTNCLRSDPAVSQFFVFSGEVISTLSQGTAQEVCRVELNLESKRVSHAIKSLRLVGLGVSFGDIDVAPMSCSTQVLPHTQTAYKSQSVRCCRSLSERMPTLEIHSAILAGSHLTAEHIFLSEGPPFRTQLGANPTRQDRLTPRTHEPSIR